MHKLRLAIPVTIFLLSILGFALIFSPNHSLRPGFSPAQSGIEDFAELDHKGNLFELYRSTKRSGAKALVLISTGIGCPIAENSLAKIQELAQTYNPRKVQFILVNSNTQDSREAIVKAAADLNISLPVLLDQSQIVADALSIDRTAEAIVLETSTFQILYRGAIDDRMNYADHSTKAQHDFLADALDDILENRQVRVAQSKTFGCAISRLSWPSPVTYYGQAAQVIENKCVSCHHTGGTRPQNLGTYQDAKGWATMIKQVVKKHRMPLEEADSFYGAFERDYSLTPEETGTLVKWVNNGAQEGIPRKIKRNKRPKNQAIRRDYVLGPAIIKHPASATASNYAVFLGRAPRDLWITGEESYSVSSEAIHHQKLIASASPLTKENSGTSGMSSIMEDKTSITENPEQRNIFLLSKNHFPDYYPIGLAKKIPRGYYMYLVQHLGLTSKEVSTENTIYLQLGDPARLTEIQRLFMLKVKGFKIPANTREFPMSWEKSLDRDIEILSIIPHLHKRGVKLSVVLKETDGTEKIILSVPRMLYDWPRQYRFKKPIFAKAGAIIKVSALFDNSDTNPNHIDYTKPVESGWEQDTNEMLFFQLEYKLPKK